VRIIWIFLSLFLMVYADQNITNNILQEQHKSDIQTKNLVDLQEKLREFDAEKENENVWIKIYSNYKTYKELKQKESELSKKIAKIKAKRRALESDIAMSKSYSFELKTIKGKLALLKEFENDPFKKSIEPPQIKNIPQVNNPIAAISALTFKKTLKENKKRYEQKYQALKKTIERLRKKQQILMKLIAIKPNSVDIIGQLKYINSEIETFSSLLEIFGTTKDVYNKKIDEIKIKLDNDIAQEYHKLFRVGGFILIFFVIFLIIKFLLHKYFANKDSFYTMNKAVNFIFLTFLAIVLLFSYLDNVSYLATVVGFASAGIAIAMKDWFMSLMGWWVIVIGGTVHVGDRVKFVRDGVEYVGDIVDISPLRMTMQEDVTLTSFMHNRRSGRIIFIPNNYVFTDMIANYSHDGLKTVWDGIDFTITFDSNIDAALSIAKEVTKKYSKGYTDITRKQLNKLRSHYHIKNTNVEPRILSFIGESGIVISAWYLTNSYATLTLRSKISQEIIQRIQESSDIRLAYQTHSLYLNGHIPKPSYPQIDEQKEREDV